MGDHIDSSIMSLPNTFRYANMVAYLRTNITDKTADWCDETASSDAYSIGDVLKK